MATKGRLLYIPSELLDELEDIQVNLKIPKKSDCMRIIAHNSKVAREIKLNLDFKDSRKNLLRRRYGKY